MKRLLFVNLLILFTFWAANAQFVSKEEASRIAIDFLQKKSSGFRSVGSAELELVYIGTDTITKNGLRSTENNLYYIFNVVTQKGFVIVSGDERTPAILGYSFEGRFILENMPDNIRYWLDNYRDQLSDLRTIPVKPATIGHEKADEAILIPSASFGTDSSLWVFAPKAARAENHLRTSFASSISPLILTKWDQGSPYNNLSPLDAGKRSVTGCVATAMAQIMKYHEWPVKGTGSKSYVTKGRKFSVSADFGSTTYAWNRMKNEYLPDNYTSEEALAVATLMKHAGVAAEMDYTNKESYAYHHIAGQGMISYFGYNPYMQLYRKYFFTDSEWIALLKEQLNAGLPIYYGGNSSSGGHAFVCDGYDNQGLFHINWGWGGYCDGYFDISRLNPDSPGLGGGSAKYTENQTVFCDVRKPYSGATPTYILNLEPAHNSTTIKTTTQSPIGRNEVFNVTIQYYNNGLNLFEGEVGVGLVSGNKLYVLGSASVNDVPNWGNSGKQFNNLKIPSSISSGTYRIYACYKHKSDTQWQYMTAKQGYPMYIDVSVTPGQIIFNKKEEEQDISFFVEKGVTVSQTIYQNEPVTFSATLKNVGKVTYKGRFGVCLISSPNTENSQVLLSSASYSVIPGISQSYTVTGKVTVPPGKYLVYPVFEKEGETYYLNKGTEMTVLEKKSDFKLSVEEAFYSYDSHMEKGKKVSFYATVKNTGETQYYDYLGLYLVNQKQTKENQYIKTNGKRIVSPGKSLLFSIEGIINLNPGDYNAYVTYEQGGKTYSLPDVYSTFTVYSPTANDRIKKEAIKLYMDPALDILYIKGNDIKIQQVEIYRLSGQLVDRKKNSYATEFQICMDSYPPGYYLVVIRSVNGIYCEKIVKQ